MSAKKFKRPTVKKALILTVGITLIGFGIWGYLQKYQATHKPNPEIPTQVITHTVEEPDETPLKETCTNYMVADHLPRQIELPGVGASGCIQRVGVTEDNAIAAPTNVHLAGWYTGSVSPGKPGVSIIDGHVSGRYSDAIFGDLHKSKVGDKVRIQLGDKSWKEFEVVSVDSYSVEQASKEQYKALPGVERQLTLITCGGNYDDASETYDQRVIVRTRLL